MDIDLQLVLFELDARRYALPLPQVDCIIRAVDVTPLPEAPLIVLGVIDVHGALVTVLSMRRRIGIRDRDIGVNDQFIVARTARRKVALAIDRACGVVGCPKNAVLNAGSILPSLDRLDGVAQLEDGLALIHDLGRFLSLDEGQELDEALARRKEGGHERA